MQSSASPMCKNNLYPFFLFLITIFEIIGFMFFVFAIEVNVFFLLLFDLLSDFLMINCSPNVQKFKFCYQKLMDVVQTLF